MGCRSVYFILLICAVISYDIISASQLLAADDGKIVGGTEMDIQDSPYMAYLLLFDGLSNYQCGGSIIGSRHILTAAHCIENILSVTIRIGSSDSDSGGQTYLSTRNLFSTHPKYNSSTFDYDVAIIKTLRRMVLDGTNATEVTLVQGGGEIPQDTMMNVTGWGTTSEGGSTSTSLMGTTVPTLSNPDCQSLLGANSITPRMLCAGLDEGGRDSCQGDSGGPAVAGGIQIGIVSWGIGCARPDSPGIYTNITNKEIRNYIKLISSV